VGVNVRTFTADVVTALDVEAALAAAGRVPMPTIRPNDTSPVPNLRNDDPVRTRIPPFPRLE
jgi:hypothetical protein